MYSFRLVRNGLNHQGAKKIKEKRMNYTPVSQRMEELATAIVDSAFQVHSQLGPGLLESVYEICFCHELKKRGVEFRCQVDIPVEYDGIRFDAGFRIDMLVEDCIVCELKVVQELVPIHKAQRITYFKLTNNRLGFLINFNVTLIRDGISRIIN
jgi:GxxExxY protein